jgi:hypothetical protein
VIRYGFENRSHDEERANLIKDRGKNIALVKINLITVTYADKTYILLRFVFAKKQHPLSTNKINISHN